MQNHQSILENIFSNAVKMENKDERASYLKIACGDDSSKLSELQSMLRDHSTAGAMFDRPAAIAPTVAAESTSHISRQIGPYKLRELLGEGGMGSVYVAEQEKPVRRKVALKIIKPGMGSREVISRFESERQALALMDHPNIARVLDAGTTDNGLPYFVMELVKGVSITEHCDAEKLTTRDRLQLFQQVCHAIQHAHQKGIIHRDIKPSNVIVAIHDVTPVVKVIDFGVAKAIGQQLTDNTLYTAVSQMVGTPLYMSPEQAGQSSLDIDTRSDVYSLGVLLYELLTGNTPFDKDTLKQAGFDEMRRIIREVDPPKPSARVSTLNAHAQSTVAGRRQIEPRKLSHQIRGDLDWIVMKAMEKDRDRRYETASAFALDVQRYMDDEPVSACPPSTAYRLKKLFRRYKGPVLAASLILLGLVVTTVLSLILAVREQKLANYERESGKRRGVIQEGINSALSEVARLRGESGVEGLSSDTLAQASEQIQRAEALAGTGTADAKSLDYIRQLAADLEQERRDRKLSSALNAAWLSKAATNPNESTFNSEPMIQLIREALTAYGLQTGQGKPHEVGGQIAGRSPATRERLLAALELWRDALEPPVGVTLHLDEGRVLVRSVSSSLRESLQRGDQLVGVGHKLTGPIVDTRSMALPEIRRLLEEAPGSSVRLEVIPKCQVTTQIHVVQRDVIADWLSAVVDASDSDSWRKRVRDAYKMGDEKQQRSELEKLANDVDFGRQPVNVIIRLAERLWEHRAEEFVLQLLRKLQQRKPSDLWVNHSLGYHLAHSSPPQYDETIRFYSVAVALSPDSAGLHLNLGWAFEKSGKLDAALAEFSEAVRLVPEYAAAHQNLGSALSQLGKKEEAVLAFRKAVQLDPGSPSHHHSLGLALLDLRDSASVPEGIQELRESVRLEPSNCPMSLRLAQKLQDRRRLDEAVEVCRACLRLNDSPALHYQLGSALTEQRKFEEAIPELREFVRRVPMNWFAHFELGRALNNQGEQLEEAVAAFRQAIVHLGPSPKHVAQRGLAMALQKQGKLDEAIAEYREVLLVQPADTYSRDNLSKILRAQGKLDEAVTARREELQHFKTDPGRLLAIYDDLGGILMELFRWDEAAEAYRGALDAERALLNDISTGVPDGRPVELRRKFVKACLKSSQPDTLPTLLREELAAWQQLASVHTDKSGCQVQMFDLQFRLAKWCLDAQQFGEAEEHFLASREPFEKLEVDRNRMLSTVAAYLKAQGNVLPVIRADMGSQELALRDAVVRNLEPLLATARGAVEASRESTDAWDRWSLIAMTHYHEQNWEGAEREAELAVKLVSDSPNKMLRIVPFFLLAGKHDAYREVCESIMDSYERWSGNDLGNAVAMCLLDPQPPRDPQRLLRLVHRTVDVGPMWSRGYLTEANVRVGGQPKALEDLLLRASLTTDDGPRMYLWLAIAHHEAGQLEEARSWLEKSLKASETGDSPNANTQMIVQVLRQEVEIKLSVNSNPKPSPSLQ